MSVYIIVIDTILEVLCDLEDQRLYVEPSLCSGFYGA